MEGAIDGGGGDDDGAGSDVGGDGGKLGRLWLAKVAIFSGHF